VPGAKLQFWYEFASTYSYPAAARIERLAAARDVEIEWRPFLLGPIFAAQGWRDSPFNVYPAKGRYMWRDLERICSREDLPFTRPSRFPRNGLLAARVALIGAAEGWVGAFTRAVYHANFAEDREISEPATIAEILRSLGRCDCAIIASAERTGNKALLKSRMEEGTELFWGNDRLEEALDWCARRA
jgi:2-hydroxychromene-2-carboxylate isomerase